MVIPDSDIMSHDEVESPLRQDQHAKIHPFSSLPRQSSIYSLTLDEFQHTLCESGRNFGSMNMDEFLNSIWTAEENQAHVQGQTHVATNPGTQFFPAPGSMDGKMVGTQGSISRQGSLTIPAPLCRKTVDEVWSEIHRTGQTGEEQEQDLQLQQHEQQQRNGGVSSRNNMTNSGSTQRQPTFGEMTLEDFLVKAGVVREQCNPPPPPQQPSPYGMYPSSAEAEPVFGSRPGSGVRNIPPYQPLAQGTEPAAYNGKRAGGYPPGPSMPAVNYGSRVGGGGGGYGLGELPVSPPSDGMGVGQVDGSNPYGMDMSGMRGGRKRIIDGPVEKVVERRQRRMIKNRESAARSRARKQAYTVELEAELNQLKDENAQLKHALAELERKRKQQYYEEAKTKVQTKAQKAKERMRMMRRSLSCPV